MSILMNKISLPADLGHALAAHRKAQKLSAVSVSARAGRSRTVLHKLERGEDVTVASLFDILRAMGLCLGLQNAGLPTLEEMQRRFADDEDEDDGAAHAA